MNKSSPSGKGWISKKSKTLVKNFDKNSFTQNFFTYIEPVEKVIGIKNKSSLESMSVTLTTDRIKWSIIRAHNWQGPLENMSLQLLFWHLFKGILRELKFYYRKTECIHKETRHRNTYIWPTIAIGKGYHFYYNLQKTPEHVRGHSRVCTHTHIQSSCILDPSIKVITIVN